MSVGGIVVESVVLEDRVWVVTKERDYPNDSPTALYVERTPESRTISEGDSFWWDHSFAYWTPKNRAFTNRKLARVGYSHRASSNPQEKA